MTSAKMLDHMARYLQSLDVAALVQGGEVTAHWLGDGSAFWYADGAPDRTVIYRVDPIANTREPMLDVDSVRAALRTALGHESPQQGVSFSDFAFLDDDRSVLFSVEGRDFIYDLASSTVTELPLQATEERARRAPRRLRPAHFATDPDIMELPSPDGRWLALDPDHNLALRSTLDGRAVPLTTDGDRAYAWTIDEAVWSPDSLRLAVRRLDNRGVAEIPIVHWLKPQEEVEWVYHARPGGRMTHTELHVVDVLARETVRVALPGPGDSPLAIVGWRPGGAELLVATVDRFHKRFDLLAADPASGTTRIILTETAETFITFPWFGPVGVTLLADGQRFIRMSERDGWNHLYLYNLDGTLIRQLTEGEFPVVEVTAVDEKSGWVYFTAHAEPRLYDTHLYRVPLDGGAIQRLTGGDGQHQIQFAPACCCFLDTHSSLDRPPVTELRAADGHLLQTLANADASRLIDLGWAPPEEFVVKAADGETDLYGILYRPIGFKPDRRYPVVELIYGGPQLLQVPRAFLDQGWAGVEARALAQLGFVVFMVEGRGTTGRSKAFQDVVYRNFGRHEIPDHVAALRQVAETRPYMDMTRVGIVGGSWGGKMTIRALLMAPDVYHVGVAINADVDSLWDGTAVEPFLGSPHDNLAGYEYANTTRLAGELRGKLLLVHGTSDINVPFAEVVRLIDALVRAGKPYDLLILPEQNHRPAGSSKDYWHDALARYLIEHLRPEDGLDTKVGPA